MSPVHVPRQPQAPALRVPQSWLLNGPSVQGYLGESTLMLWPFQACPLAPISNLQACRMAVPVPGLGLRLCPRHGSPEGKKTTTFF